MGFDPIHSGMKQTLGIRFEVAGVGFRERTLTTEDPPLSTIVVGYAKANGAFVVWMNKWEDENEAARSGE
ncbi:hypothetical protein HAX54_017138, partial [Datura stramonium]|nr:hypothetical protein [Datura stramonium]